MRDVAVDGGAVGGGAYWDAADEYAPAVGVVGRCIAWSLGGVGAEGYGFAAEGEGAVDLSAADTF